ncbi:RNA polymerase sigma factor [Motilibacter peucedani]|uniref:RNA polymerase sigma factor n=1 Tax=Motilibacter peucedani TaxID=598650 RepID=UPI000EB39C25|nr:sigma-70 family RNA polymerase sigma factor [Motilibacter peucedani]
MTPTDSSLLRSAGHDPAAFRALYERYAEALHGFFVRRTGEPDAALDLTAETFAQAWTHRHRFDDVHDGSCGPWLFGIARNLLLRAVRDRRLAMEASERMRLSLARSGATPGPEWVDGLEVDLLEALAGLPEGQRRAVELRVLDDQPYERVAAELGVSPGAARVRVSRGISQLRTSLDPHLGKDPS